MEHSLDSLLERKIDEKFSEQFERFRADLEEDFARRIEEVVNPPALMSRSATADYLGVSFPTLHGLMNSGALGYVKVGRSTKFRRSEVEALLKSRSKRRA